MPLSIARRYTASLVSSLALAVIVAGCTALSARPEAPPAPGDLPSWTSTGLYDHLRMFNVSVDDRATGSPGYARAAVYVAARMRDIGLQPALGEAFRVVYQTPINHPIGAMVAGVGGDTLRFLPGIDHLPDARSDSGAVRTREVYLDPHAQASAEAALTGRVVFAPATAATDAYLQGIRAAGARAAVLVGTLDPRRAAQQMPGVLVVQLTLDAAARLLGRTDALVPGTAGPVTLPHAVSIRVMGEHLPLAVGINTLGYVPGSHPVLANELVLVCADLDAAPSFSGGHTLDLGNMGTGAAALLKAGERVNLLGSRTSVPERSMLFAVWSGARLGHVGLRAYLRSPLWPLDATRAVVYVGLRPEDEPGVRALLATHGLPLYVVPAPAPVLDADRVMVFPTTAVRRQAVARGARELRGEDRTPGIDLSDVLSQAADEALRLAQQATDLALPLTVNPAPRQPVQEDTLWRTRGD